uniref:C2H2-type domain-containing protein n=1 Tax=Glossina brevipalpis TaxID=37001 RepID=A0A1A9W8C9_9MUSC
MMETINQAQTEAVNISSPLVSSETQSPPPVQDDNQKNTDNSLQFDENTKRCLTQEPTTTNNCIKRPQQLYVERFQLSEENEDGNLFDHENSKKLKKQEDALAIVKKVNLNKIVKSPSAREEENENSPDSKKFKYEVGNDIGGEHISKTRYKVLYNDEDELLRSDDEDYDDDDVEGKDVESKSLDNISKEEEEQLLRSDDDEQTQNELVKETSARFSYTECEHPAVDIMQQEPENIKIDSSGNNDGNHHVLCNLEKEDSNSRLSSNNNNEKLNEFGNESSDNAPRLKNNCGQDNTSQTTESLTQQSLLETTTDVNDLDEKDGRKDVQLAQCRSNEHQEMPNKSHNQFAVTRNSPKTQITFENVFADKNQTGEECQPFGKWHTNMINADGISKTSPTRPTQLNGEHTSTDRFLPNFSESIANTRKNVSPHSSLSSESISLNNSKPQSDQPENLKQIEEAGLHETSVWNQSFGDEGASRSSINSCSSDSSNTSTSSQQLVIDHPMDDLVKDEKVKSFKADLKRKLSHSSASESTEPQQKQLHLEDKNDNNSYTFTDSLRGSVKVNDEHIKMEENLEKTPLEIPVDRVSEKQLAYETSSHVEGTKQKAVHLQVKEERLILQDLEDNDKAIVFKTNNEANVPLQTPESCKSAVALPEATVTFKSLLLQQLEKPLMPPPVTPVSKPSFQHPNNVLATPPSLALETSVPVSKISQSILLPPSTSVAAPTASANPIKYFCFKCKGGAFESFSALTEHQSSCLNLDNPLPGNNNSLKTSEVVKESRKSVAAAIPLTGRKRYYKCSSCGTFHENWSLFLHVREKHNRHMCLYCSRFFPTAEKLALHLEIKHDLEQNHYHSEEALRNCATVLKGNYPLEARFLMCCTCQHMFGEDESFSHHDCAEYVAPCSLCGQKGRHTNQCKAYSEAKHFSKTKKKKEKPQIAKKPQTKELVAPPLQPSTNHQALTTLTTGNESLTSILNCDTKGSAAPLAVNDLHIDDSNSNSNMVIDESCTTSHPVTQKNPFKELDERERLEEQQDRAMAEVELPPDRLEGAHTATVTPPKLIVPKFKLRVPKEFQKSVDAALSTSDSDEAEYGDNDAGHSENLTEKSKQNESSLTGTPSASCNERTAQNNDITMPATENVINSATADQKVLNPNNSLDEDDSLDEPNSNLLRIMQEIERTKLDIQRTKKVSKHATKPHVLPRPSATSSQSSQGAAEQNWSPTPPASPNSRWFPMRANAAQQKQDQCNLAASHQPTLLPPPITSNDDAAITLKMQERRDTIGSDVMDIDETISGQPTQTVMRNELTQSTNTSTDSNITKTLDISHSAESETEESKMSPNSQTEVFQKTRNIIDSDENLQSPNKLEIQVNDNHLTPLNSSSHTDLEQKDISGHSEATGEDEDKDIDVCGGSNKESDEIMQSTDEADDRGKELPADGIEVAGEDTLTTELQLDRPIDKYEIIEFVRICLKAVYPLCLYCNYARRIAVNGKSLVLHIIANHRFVATVDSITAEELYSDTIMTKLKSFLPDLEEHHFNLSSYCSGGMSTFTIPFDERLFECFQCRFVTSAHKELYLHNRKMHLRTAILCFMCRAHFFSFSEILCHICPGVANKVSVFDVKFRCCLCNVDNIPSPFRLMVHLRKRHFACDVCLEDCRDQSRLSSHVWKHKLHHLCYRCGIAYRNKMDITKHLFWKHGTESTICKRCLQKRWRHVYHFCIPPQTFLCEVCNMCFTKAMHLRVHKRLHTGDLRYPCVEDNCEEKFISRKLLLKHAAAHEATVASAELKGPKESGNVLKEEDEKPEMGFAQIKEESILVKKEPFEDSEIRVENTLKMQESGEKSNLIVTESESQKMEIKSHPIEQDTPRKRRNRKHKRPKELLDDLNLTAPNLSESDSSDDDSDSDSKTKSELDALPRVMLSPPSEAENEEEMSAETDKQNPGEVLEIWKNFLKTQQGTNAEELKPLIATADYTEDNYPIPNRLHVVYSDHDYCAMYRPQTPLPLPEIKNKSPVRMLTPQDNTPKHSPMDKGTGKSPFQLSSKKSENSSSSSGSSSSSDTTCTCGSNCSCSSSESDSSSTSSSSDDSDTSAASNNSMRKKHRKKSERDRLRKKSESLSPVKNANKLNTSEIINVEDFTGPEREKDASENIASSSPPKEPPFCESDLETNESETDEEFYDEHPQKLANELLAQKRAQLMAQTRLSPSHNYDIVENSRPSTPSLPEEVAGNEKIKVKVKKKKRDRKTSCKATGLHNNHSNNMQSASLEAGTHDSELQQLFLMSAMETQIPPPLTIAHPTGNIYAPAAAIADEQSSLSRPLNMATALYGVGTGRMSEGSSCSDADGSLKRSKRARRPNKFYGYTSDDENITSSSFGQPLMIGMRAFKPQPPPQLTWRKEDLPTPSKSILNNRNKATRIPKPSGGLTANLSNSSSSHMTGLSNKKKSRLTAAGEKLTRKRSSKKKEINTGSNLPPIPTLKIRPSEIGLNNKVKQSSSQGEYNMSESSSDDDSITTNAISTTLAHFIKPNHNLCGPLPLTNPAAALLPSAPPPPPTPQTKAFNHKIPPALLPNPDFATLQYFKANNIRYPIRPPAGARQPREGESVYCYCRCPYDEVSEMIACDGESCLIEWFHFECVGIMVAPQGKWFCAECRPKYSEELYPTTNLTTGNDINV